MSPFHDSDDILSEWLDLADRATIPSRAPRGGRSGSQLRVGFAGIVALLIVAAIIAPRAFGPTGPASSSSPSGISAATPTPGSTRSPNATPSRPVSQMSATPGPSVAPSASEATAPTRTDCWPTATSPTFTIGGIASNWHAFTWSPVAAGSPLAAFEGGVFEWNGFFVAHGQMGGTVGCIWTSPDGLTWTSVLEAPSLLVAASDTSLLAITTDSADATANQTFWRSPDGKHWTNVGTSSIGHVTSLAGTPAGLVAVATAQTGTGKFATTQFQVWWSPNEAGWTQVDVEPNLVWDEYGPLAQAGNGRFFLMGGIPAPAARDQGAFRLLSGAVGTPVMFWSDDGRSWHRSTGGSYYGTGIDFATGGMILHSSMRLVPGGTDLSLSTDGGKTWKADSTFSPVGSVDCSQVQGECSSGPDGIISSNGSLFVAVKNDGHAWTSSDGKTWTAITWGGPSASGGMVVLPGGVVVSSVNAAGAPVAMYGAAK